MIPYLILRVTAFDFASGLIPVNIETGAHPVGLRPKDGVCVSVWYSYS